jgi:hypothetical protein
MGSFFDVQSETLLYLVYVYIMIMMQCDDCRAPQLLLHCQGWRVTHFPIKSG